MFHTPRPRFGALADLLLPARRDETAPERLTRVRATRVALGAALACLLLSFAGSLMMPVLGGADEVAHLAYSANIIEGRLPTVDDAIKPNRLGALDDWIGTHVQEYAGTGRMDVWVANHPPLFATLAAPFAWAGDHVGNGRIGAQSLRWLNALPLAASVVLVAALCWALRPGDAALAALASVITACTAQVQHVGSYGYTDGLALFCILGSLVCAARLLRWGPSRGLLVASSAFGLGAALTRASALPAVALLVLAALVAQPGGGIAWPDIRTLKRAAAVLALPLLVAGPFYLRNIDHYGDPTASAYLLEKFERVEGPPAENLMVDPQFLGSYVQRVWTAYRTGTSIGHMPLLSRWEGPGWPVVIPLAIALLAIVGGVSRRGLLARARSADPTACAIWTGLLLWCFATLVGITTFVSHGGNAHPRYLVPIVPVIAAALAAGLTARRSRAWTVLTMAAAATLGGIGIGLSIDLRLLAMHGGIDPGIGVPGWADPLAVTALLAATAVMLALIVPLWRVLRSDPVVPMTVEAAAERPGVLAPASIDLRPTTSDLALDVSVQSTLTSGTSTLD